MKSGNRFAVVVTAEHASLKIPDRYRGLGLSAQQQRSHIAWDEGSVSLAREIARQIRAPRHGVMPAWRHRLGDDTVKKLAVFVHSLGGGE